MKKLKVLLWIFILPLPLIAQNSNEKTQTKLQPLNQHQLLFKARTNQNILDFQYKSPQILPTPIEFEFDMDTIWNFDESKTPGTDIFSPTYFGQQFDIGNSDNYINYNNNFEWHGDTTGWVLTRKSMQAINEQFMDSSKSFYMDELGNPLYGDFYMYIREPSEGATSESYLSRFDADQGWIKDSRSLQYNNEDHSITWNKYYRFNPTLMEYVISNESTFEELDTHYLYEYKSYNEGLLTNWNKRYSVYNENGNTIYSTKYNYNTSFEALEPTDSTAFVYHEGFIEAFGFKWYTDTWELNTYSRTFESKSILEANDMRMDSILTYEVIYSTELDSMVAGIVLSKSEWLYDENENMTSYTYFNNYAGEMIPYNKTTHEYKLIDGIFHQSINRSYIYSYTNLGLYLQSEWHNLRNDDGSMEGDLNFYFSESGDTTSGYMSEIYFEGNSFYSFNYNWETQLGDFVKTGFSMHSEEDPVSQYSFESEWGNNRSIFVMKSLPAAVNPGPLFLALGDTLNIIISAMNPDLSTPELSITGLPATATFDSDTRQLYWIVDEEIVESFQVTAINGLKSSTIDVKLVFGEFTVDTEAEVDIPEKITLYQNYPNPFNPSTTISFELSSPANVTLTVYNLLGQTVQVLLNQEHVGTGKKNLKFDAGQLSSGIYFYQLEIKNDIFTRKMTLTK